MSPAATEHTAATPQLRKSRTIGVVYLLYFLTAILSVAVASRPHLAFAFNVISLALYVAVVILFYLLFKPVNHAVSLLAALVGLAGCIVQALALFEPHSAAANLSPLAFFGPYCILIGFLILKCVFLPRFLGALMILAGIAWLLVLVPVVAKHLLGPAEAIGLLAELLLCLWLLVFGVNRQRSNEQRQP
jgi:hypothetical protein